MIKLRAILRSIFVRLFRLTSGRGFRSFGQGVYIFPGADVSGMRSIEIGDGVIVLDNTILQVHQGHGDHNNQTLRIGSGSSIGRRNHIFALNRIEIGANVITASNVYISDCTHGFSDPATPIMHQPVLPLRPVVIGEGTWIGQNACIVGCSVGRNCVIGAGAVVLDDVPDFSVAVGSPARVVKRFNSTTGDWERVHKHRVEFESDI